jgi:hypothetical protein
VVAVEPLVSLLAETATTGRFTERHVHALRALAALPAASRAALLISADRLASADATIDTGERRDLLEVLGLYGVRLCIELIGQGTTSGIDLLNELRERSGFERLREQVLLGFARDADALKANGAVAAVERVAYAMTDPSLSHARADLHDGIDALRTDAAMHRLAELRVANVIAAGELVLPPGRADEALRLVSAGSVASRLGLADTVTSEEIASAAAAAAASWKQFGNDGRAGPEQQWLADVINKTCERIWIDATRLTSGGAHA